MFTDLTRWTGERYLPVLAYHSLSGARHARDELCTSVDRFADQVAALRAAGYRLAGLTDALHADRPTVAVTFDDAYADFLDAVPVLAEHDASATLYAPSGLVGRPPAADNDLPVLTRHDLAALAVAGIEIGAHGRVHVPLDVADPQTLRREVHEARRELEDWTAAPVRSFAYPHGYANRRSRAAVVDAGYANACVLGHALHRRDGDPFAVRRLLVTSADDAQSVLRRVRWSVTSVRTVYTGLLGVPWRLARLAANRRARTGAADHSGVAA